MSINSQKPRPLMDDEYYKWHNVTRSAGMQRYHTSVLSNPKAISISNLVIASVLRRLVRAVTCSSCTQETLTSVSHMISLLHHRKRRWGGFTDALGVHTCQLISSISGFRTAPPVCGPGRRHMQTKLLNHEMTSPHSLMLVISPDWIPTGRVDWLAET